MSYHRSSLDSTISAYFVEEDDPMRRNLAASANQPSSAAKSAGGAGSKFGSHRGLQKLMASAIGNIKVDRSGRQMYFTAKDCIKVRRTLELDGLFQMEKEAPAKVFQRVLKPRINDVFQRNRDLVVFVAGEANTSKSTLLHGASLDPHDSGVDVPPKSNWGLAFHVVEEILRQSETNTCEIMATALRFQLEHIADLLVSTSGLRLTKIESQKRRQQYARLVALSKASTLELEEDVNGRFSITDQLDTTIRKTEDFMHVVNCHAAINAGKGAVMKLSKNQACPFHFVTTLRIWRRDVAPNYIHLVELADTNWLSSSEEDNEIFRRAFSTISDINAAILSKDLLKIKSSLRNTLLTRFLYSNINLESTDFVYFGLSHFSQTLPMMEFLGKCVGRHVSIVLHGPDGEGEEEVDPELREHVLTIQRQCDELRGEVEALRREKEGLENKILDGEDTIGRLKQQCDIVKKLATTLEHKELSAMTMTKRTAGKGSRGMGLSLSLSGATPSQKELTSASSAVAATTTAQKAPAPAVTHEGSFNMDEVDSVTPSGNADNASTSEAQRVKVLTLEKELQSMKEDAEHKTEACQQQIHYVNAEKARIRAKSAKLEKEYNELKQKYEAQETQFARERAHREAEMQQKINDIIEQNKNDLENHNALTRQLQSDSMQRSLEKQEQRIARERILGEELQRAAEELSTSIEKEHAANQGKEGNLERELEALTQKRLTLESEAREMDTVFKEQIDLLDRQSSSLCQYAYEMTKVVSNFENYNSTAARRAFRTVPKCGVPIFDPTVKHSSEWITRQCVAMREWLDKMGYPRPLVYCEVKSGNMELLETVHKPKEAEKVVQAQQTQTDSIRVEKEVKDYTAILHDQLSRQNHFSQIAAASRQRLEEMEKKKQVKGRPASASRS